MVRDYYVKVEMKNKEGKLQDFHFHPSLYSLINTGIDFMKKNRHFFGLITGGVGDGKSNLAVSLGALWEYKNNRKFGFDNMVWTTKSFIEKTNREDNKTSCILWDEAIQGATGKKMALTTEGELLKISIVTKRFKKHFYILLVDEIEEYSWKLIKMANFWIHVKNQYGERGSFDMYVDKGKIKAIYQAFKYYKWDWSKVTLRPDFKGNFNPYLNDLLSDKIYDDIKLKETQVIEKSSTPQEVINKTDVLQYIDIKQKREQNIAWKELGGDKIRMWFNRMNERLNSI